MQRTLLGKDERAQPGHGGETASNRSPAARPTGGGRFDWAMILLSAWFLGGVFLDGWAHNHIPELESFFTPWHAVLYSGYAAVAGFLIAALLRHRRQGFAWRQALPAGYELSLSGVVIFLVGGIGDMLWHELFGIEADVEALVSPTHLILAVGGSLMMGGPFFAAWRRPHTQTQTVGWRTDLPALLSLTFLLSVWTFMTQFAHPLVDPWAAIGFRPPAPSRQAAYLRQALGVASILLQSGLSMGLVLLAVLRWRLPFGSLTLVFGLNALLMSFMQDQYRFIPGAVVAGLAADLLLRWLRPSAVRSAALRLFAGGVPVVFYGMYFVTLIVTSGVEWAVHLWAGSVALAGIAGWLLSYLIAPPVQVSSREVS
jgi:hypothetical protein